jgi:hypothetical protein
MSDTRTVTREQLAAALAAHWPAGMKRLRWTPEGWATVIFAALPQPAPAAGGDTPYDLFGDGAPDSVDPTGHRSQPAPADAFRTAPMKDGIRYDSRGEPLQPAADGEPRTSAGRALLDYLRDHHHSASFQTPGKASPAYQTSYNPSYQRVADALPAIEAEAAQQSPFYCLNAEGHTGRHSGWVNGEWSVTDTPEGPVLHMPESIAPLEPEAGSGEIDTHECPMCHGEGRVRT